VNDTPHTASELPDPLSYYRENQRLAAENEALKLYRALIRSALVELYAELQNAGDQPMNVRMMQALHRLALINSADKDRLSDALHVYRLRSALGTADQHTLDRELLVALSSIAPFVPPPSIK
jgi:hypothetical protein